MEIDLIIDSKLPNNIKTNFFNYLKSKQTKDIEKIEWKTLPTKPGQMGNGATLNAVGTLIASSQTSLVEFFKTIQVWIQLYQKEVSIKGPFGEEITFKTNKLSEKALLELANKFVVDSRKAEKDLRSGTKKTTENSRNTKKNITAQNTKTKKDLSNKDIAAKKETTTKKETESQKTATKKTSSSRSNKKVEAEQKTEAKSGPQKKTDSKEIDKKKKSEPTTTRAKRRAAELEEKKRLDDLKKEAEKKKIETKDDSKKSNGRTSRKK